MKKIFNVVLNVLPFFIWIGWFLLALNNAEINPDLGTIQILLLLGLPLVYSVYNVIFSAKKKNFLMQNFVFGVAQVVGYYISGLLYYDYISSDSETILVNNTFSAISVVYILITTLIFYGISVVVEKLKRKWFFSPVLTWEKEKFTMN